MHPSGSHIFSENIYKVFCHIFGEKRLWCSIDKWGIFRGTKGLKFEDDAGHIIEMDRPDWRYQLRPHWYPFFPESNFIRDVNPWVHVKQMQAKEWPMYGVLVPHAGSNDSNQGLVALDDCPEEVGGFQTVPGSANYLPLWCKDYLVGSFQIDDRAGT